MISGCTRFSYPYASAHVPWGGGGGPHWGQQLQHWHAMTATAHGRLTCVRLPAVSVALAPGPAPCSPWSPSSSCPSSASVGSGCGASVHKNVLSILASTKFSSSGLVLGLRQKQPSVRRFLAAIEHVICILQGSACKKVLNESLPHAQMGHNR